MAAARVGARESAMAREHRGNIAAGAFDWARQRHEQRAYRACALVRASSGHLPPGNSQFPPRERPPASQPRRARNAASEKWNGVKRCFLSASIRSLSRRGARLQFCCELHNMRQRAWREEERDTTDLDLLSCGKREREKKKVRERRRWRSEEEEKNEEAASKRHSPLPPSLLVAFFPSLAPRSPVSSPCPGSSLAPFLAGLSSSRLLVSRGLEARRQAPRDGKKRKSFLPHRRRQEGLEDKDHHRLCLSLLSL